MFELDCRVSGMKTRMEASFKYVKTKYGNNNVISFGFATPRVVRLAA